MWCKSCRVTGYTHCAHPDECGNMVTLTAAADSWKSWLDDAPLPETFNSATGGLQDFITALSRALLTARAEHAASLIRINAEAVEAVAQASADAQAAVVLVVEQAADACVDLAAQVSNAALTGLPEQARLRESMEAAFTKASHVIRALAPADGLAAVDALRAEIADLKMNMDADLRTMVREGQQLRTLAAELAAAQQREAALTKALEACVASLERVDTAEGVCCCGDSMDRHSDPMSCGHSPVDMGDYYAGQALESARTALAQTPTDPGDGWTWNERLGWIGPDGKPADPRRRG